MGSEEKIFDGDSGGFGVIRGKGVVLGVLDGTIRVNWGETG